MIRGGPTGRLPPRGRAASGVRCRRRRASPTAAGCGPAAACTAARHSPGWRRPSSTPGYEPELRSAARQFTRTVEYRRLRFTSRYTSHRLPVQAKGLPSRWLPPRHSSARRRTRRQPQGSSRECPQRFVHPRHRRDRVVRQGVHPARCSTTSTRSRRRRLQPRRAQAVRGAASCSATTRGCAGSSATSATEHRLLPRDARRRLRRPRRRAEAGRHRRSTTRSSSSRPTSSARRTSSRPCIDAGVKKVVALSTDKASSPINLYGATKLTADKLFITGNHYAAAYATRFCGGALRQRHGQPRLGHPVLPRAARGRASRCRSPTCAAPGSSSRCRRRCEFVVDSFELMQGGELYVPRIPSMKITDLAQADRARREDARRRAAPRREAARGDDLARRRAAARSRLGDRYVLQPDLASWGYTPPADGVPVARRLPLPLRQQRPVVHPARRSRKILETRRLSACCPTDASRSPRTTSRPSPRCCAATG